MAFDRFLIAPLNDYSHVLYYNQEMRKIRKDFKDISNQRFGKLIAIEPFRDGRKLKWKCKCDCGKIYNAVGIELRIGATKSCGSCRYIRQYDRGVISVYCQYRDKAKKRKIPFYLGEREFEKLIKKNCHYCKLEPYNFIKDKRSNSIKIIYSGIDRIDSSKGYIKSNCVPCCKRCNLAKSDLTIEEFKNHIVRIYQCLIDS